MGMGGHEGGHGSMGGHGCGRHGRWQADRRPPQIAAVISTQQEGGPNCEYNVAADRASTIVSSVRLTPGPLALLTLSLHEDCDTLTA